MTDRKRVFSRRRLVVGALAVGVVGVGAPLVAVSGVLDGTPDDGEPAGQPTTSLATVKRGSLSKQIQLAGTLGYAGSYTVTGRRPGTVTWLPASGQVIEQGHVLYEVDGVPVILLFGATPAYRSLGAAAVGKDVAQLNHALVALGFLRASDVDGRWARFGGTTRTGVKRLQHRLGLPQTGELDAGDVVFLPTAARVTELAADLGGPADGAVLRATSTTPVVTVALAADLQSVVAVGDQVAITVPDGKVTTGTVASVGKVAVAASEQSGGSVATPTVPVTVTPADRVATSGWDQAPVLVAITTATVADVLAVPVYALLARSGGGYAVEVVDANGARRLVEVTPGLFDDATGLVQVAGAGLADGQRIVVPAS
ncbi:MAG: peptidoglycan-binding protein [Hamadaea sp.]|uniref:peptidoglycan-binding protein n=1 Tax=Hamadaea sp. TaxID=2024425 RepID=UPI001829CF9C|nr:peptidoglycan-binding domain-containing protein [Hamadaea sp.]NUR71417.1 peptidoglycan-binding protein [Hamadaea sp.]NUT23727.1 peptidoglycan-binding protein [Hamadaea sp.]